MHYARIPREYWRSRLKMAKAMGLNTVTTYVFWNVHEPKPGVFDFSGNADVAEFIRGKAIPGEGVGLLSGVIAGGKPVTSWDNYSLPFEAPEKLAYSSAPCVGACFYRSSFKVNSMADTFLDTSTFTKGQVWINGHNLGRVWNAGPQKALYLPGPWLHKGMNDVVVLDLQGQPGGTLWGLDDPVLDGAVLKAGTAN
jgi:beta-galactosidase GanA